MKQLSLEEFADEHVATYDELVEHTTDIDKFCSSSDWILPAHYGFTPERSSWLFRADDGYVAMMQGTHEAGWRYIEPMEALWGLASPLIGSNPIKLVADFAELCWNRADEWDVLCLSGIYQGSPMLDALLEQMAGRCEILEARLTTRHVASLRGGLDGFLSRRSRNLRRSLERSLRRAASSGIRFQSCRAKDDAEADAIYERVLDVEGRSWKGLDGIGINTGRMCEFYRLMIRRLAARGAQRTIFARHQGKDVAYVLGGTFGPTYRGLQMSYDDDCRRHALGNLCQYQQIAELCDQGIEEYDLGTGIDYKLRWAESLRISPIHLVVKQVS